MRFCHNHIFALKSQTHFPGSWFNHPVTKKEIWSFSKACQSNWTPAKVCVIPSKDEGFFGTLPIVHDLFHSDAWTIVWSDVLKCVLVELDTAHCCGFLSNFDLLFVALKIFFSLANKSAVSLSLAGNWTIATAVCIAQLIVWLKTYVASFTDIISKLFGLMCLLVIFIALTVFELLSTSYRDCTCAQSVTPSFVWICPITLN